MSVFPGFCGDIASTPYRLFLGTLPHLGVHERLLRQLQPVFAWYTSRRRVKEQASEFVELDLASCDPEMILRYCHVYYVRRQLYDELIDKQLTMIEVGKATALADSGLLACLAECNALVAPRIAYELRALEQAKRACASPGRRELRPQSLLEPHDHLCMMRVVEEDVGGVIDGEMRAKAFLPRDLVESHARELITRLLGDGVARPSLDKKEMKLLQRMIPADYLKVGSVHKLRPCDATALFRFVGERGEKDAARAGPFRRFLWGHLCRKFITHPAYLRASSLYWARFSGMDPSTARVAMPMDVAQAVCVQQSLFPAMKFRSQFLYTSPELARRQWRVDGVIPLLRLFPMLGARAAEDLAAGAVVESGWAQLQLDPATNPLQEGVLQAMRHLVNEVSELYVSNPEAVYRRVIDGVRVTCPPLSDEESRSVGPTGTAADAAQGEASEIESRAQSAAA